MKVTFSLSFYHIPKFLKNDLIKRLEINIQFEYSFLNSQTFEAVNGGAKRDRTVDLLRARQALSQLSYGPVFLQVFPHKIGGSGQIRTADLTLIRGAL